MVLLPRSCNIDEQIAGCAWQLDSILPLEISGARVTEFLLVPWVGACIHTPPTPPRNQIVYVKSDQGIEIPSRFAGCYLAGELGDYLDQHGIKHTRGRPYNPMTLGKIERYHRTMKNFINLEHYYLPWQL